MVNLLLVVLAFLLPPLAVYLHENACNNQVLLNLLLTIIGFYVIGLIHALWTVTR